MASADEILASLRRPASVGQVGGFRPPDDPLTTWLGQVRALGRDESWPTLDGVPMLGVCQIAVAELPCVPPALSDVAMLTLFMRGDDGYPAPPAGEDDTGWEIRTYADLGDLTVVEAPAATAVKPFPVRWTAVSDLPARDDAVAALGAAYAEVEPLYDDEEAGLRPVDGFKVGGWPTLIQSEIYWAAWNRHPAEPEFVLQVDSDEKTGIAWGHGGVLHVGRGVADPSLWALEWQCM